MATAMPAEEEAASGGSILQARRRLSVVSDNKLIEGFSHLDMDDDRKAASHVEKTGPAEDGEFVPCSVSKYAGFSKKGFAPYNPGKRNQDALIMAEDPTTGTLFLACLDGHGEAGDKVAQAFKRELVPALFGHSDWAEQPAAAMAETIARIEGALLADPGMDTDFSGSTLVAAAVRGNHITIGNVGDSRITLGTRDAATGAVRAESLSRDHKPDLPGERARILAAGGRVFAVEYDDGVDGPPRVWLGHMDVPGLAMSRSLGDKVAHSAGVSSEVEFTTRTLQPHPNAGDDIILLLATDGLWEFMSNEECMAIAAGAGEPRLAVDALITEANERWMREEQVIDDTTVCVAFLGGWNGASTGSDK